MSSRCSVNKINNYLGKFAIEARSASVNTHRQREDELWRSLSARSTLDIRRSRRLSPARTLSGESILWLIP